MGERAASADSAACAQSEMRENRSSTIVELVLLVLSPAEISPSGEVAAVGDETSSTTLTSPTGENHWSVLMAMPGPVATRATL